MTRAGLRGAATAVMAALALASACAGPSPGDPAACEGVASRASGAGAPERWIIGLASRYPADTTLRARADELRRSQRARRAAAWEAVARTLAPVPLARPTGVPGARVPRFRTWYDREDVARTFGRLYSELGPEGRAAQARFTEGALDAALGWNVDFATTLDVWTQERLDRYAASLDTAAAIAGTNGIQRIALSPDAARHLMSSYPEVLRCLAQGAPPPYAEGPAEATQRLAREPLALSGCDAQSAGPFFVARGGELVARVEGDGGDAVDVRVLEGPTGAGAERCSARGAAGCVVQGPGVFTVRVAPRARREGASGMLEVRYTPPAPRVAACLNGVFPAASATVALEWRRTGIGVAFPVFDTSAAGLARRLGAGGAGTWGDGDGAAEPDERAAYTMRLETGSVFRLAGMHIRTRELDHWLNITLWWSPAPDEDFGADRPASVRALGAPWTSYKMCVATDYDEQDGDPAGGFAESAPSLAAALRVVHEGRGGPSWCSNPYIDAGPGLVRSNCVGCHQHAMSGVRPGMVQTDPARYPHNGRAQVRDNYPSDQFWGLDGGDQFASVLVETVDHWRAAR